MGVAEFPEFTDPEQLLNFSYTQRINEALQNAEETNAIWHDIDGDPHNTDDQETELSGGSDTASDMEMSAESGCSDTEEEYMSQA